MQQALRDAQRRGLDLLGQQRFAMKIVRSIRSDMSETEILEKINAAYTDEEIAATGIEPSNISRHD